MLRLTGGVLGWKGLSAAAGGAVAIVTARQLAPTGRGMLVLIITTASFALLITGLGINVSGRIHLVSRAESVTSGGFLGLTSALSGAQVLICVILGAILLPLAHVSLSGGDELAFGALGGSLLGQYILLDVLNAFGHLRFSAGVDASGSIAQLLLSLILVAGGERHVTPYVIALTAANGMQILISLVALKHFGVSIRPRYRPPEWILLIRSGLPAIFIGFGQVLTFRLDRYLVGITLSPAAVGIYSVAATAPELLRLVPLSWSTPLFHRIAAGLAVPADFRRMRSLCLATVLFCVVVTFVLAPPAVRILFGVQYQAAVTPLRILLLAEFGVAIFCFDGGALSALNQIWRSAVAVIAALIIVTVGDIVLIPRYALAGAAWASVMAYSVMGLVAHRFLRHQQARETMLHVRVSILRHLAPPETGGGQPGIEQQH